MMTYKKKSTITIPDYYGQAIGDWLIARFLEMFGTDELIQEYIDSSHRGFNEIKLVELNLGGGLGVISISDYQEFLDNLQKNLPKKYRKKGSPWKPWFRNVVPLVDMKYWPLTFEAGAKYAEGRQLAALKQKSKDGNAN